MSTAHRPPSDAIVALHSLGRRWRSVFAGLGEDESPDDLAGRAGADGTSALDHAVHATRTLSLLDRALEQVLVEEAPVLHPAVGDPSRRVWDAPGSGDVETIVAELAHEADRLAERGARATADDWTRRARVADEDADLSSLAILWDAVDTAVADLKAAEAVLREVRGRR